MCAANIPTCIIFHMHIIPVIDLKDGLVVMAGPGERQTYQPLATPLCPKPDILAVTRAYLSLSPFKTFYIADLNAIENNGDNHTLITRLLKTNDEISLWIDSGLKLFSSRNSSSFQDRVCNVLGSETGIAIDQLADYTRKPDSILSLDYTGRRLLGNIDLLERPDLLPRRLIIMALERVGSNRGPDLERICNLIDKMPDKQVYAAGGVRNADDLRLLAARGVHGALLASSLHNRMITREHLNTL